MSATAEAGGADVGITGAVVAALAEVAALAVAVAPAEVAAPAVVAARGARIRDSSFPHRAASLAGAFPRGIEQGAGPGANPPALSPFENALPVWLWPVAMSLTLAGIVRPP